MPASYYDMCRRGVGKAVEIRTHDGRIHRGIIHRVDNRMVYLRPLPQRNYGGYGYPWGWGWGWGGFGLWSCLRCYCRFGFSSIFLLVINQKRLLTVVGSLFI